MPSTTILMLPPWQKNRVCQVTSASESCRLLLVTLDSYPYIQIPMFSIFTRYWSDYLLVNSSLIQYNYISCITVSLEFKKISLNSKGIRRNSMYFKPQLENLHRSGFYRNQWNFQVFEQPDKLGYCNSWIRFPQNVYSEHSRFHKTTLDSG
jgi:hypothetical protein